MLNAVRPFIDFYRVASFAASDPSRPDFRRSLRRMARSLSHGWHAASRYRRLELMSDEELARLGLDRASIARHAFFGDRPSGTHLSEGGHPASEGRQRIEINGLEVSFLVDGLRGARDVDHEAIVDDRLQLAVLGLKSPSDRRPASTAPPSSRRRPDW